MSVSGWGLSIGVLSSPLLSFPLVLTPDPSGAPAGPLIKEQVRLSISLTATRAEQRHTNTRAHLSELHLSQCSYLMRSPDTLHG